jgi:glyoxylase-like metal-dependent hydrolase (beta-lactamase superfamily II)
MKSWKTKGGYEIFRVLSGRSNSYFITTDRLNFLFDTGKVSAFRKLQSNLDKLYSQNKNIDFLILTHTHFDHCQNAAQIQRQGKCIILMSDKELNYVQKGYTPVPRGTMLFSKVIYKLGIHMGLKRFSYAPFTPDLLIRDNFQFKEVKLDLRILETPGHSSGSISILVDNEIAIVGDALFGIFPNSVFPPYADSANELIKSWNKLLKTNCDVFLPGHGREIKRALLQKEYHKLSQKYSSSSDSF